MLVSAHIRAQLKSLRSYDEAEENEGEGGGDTDIAVTSSTGINGECEESMQERHKSYASSTRQKSSTRQLPWTDKFHLGAMQPDCTIADLVEEKKSDVAFNNFKRRLTDFINLSFRVQNIPFPDNRYIRLPSSDIVSALLPKRIFL